MPSRQLRQQGLHFTDELTPQQQQTQKVLDPDHVALLSKGFCTWFRHGTLWYMDQGVCRERRKGKAIRLPHTQDSPTGSQEPNARALVPARGPHGGHAHPPPPLPRCPGSAPKAISRGPRGVTPSLLRDNGVISPIPPSCHFPMARACSTACSTAATSSYANIAGSGPITAMNIDAAASSPAAPAAAPNSTLLPAL